MRKVLFTSVLVVTFCLIGVYASQGQQFVIKFAHNDPANLEVTKHAYTVYFKNFVEAKTEGKVRVDIFPAEQLGAERENIEGVKMGTIQMSSVSDTVFAGFVPEMLSLGYPYAFFNEQAVYNFWEGPVGQRLTRLIFEKLGARVVGFGDLGFRHFTNSRRPIRTPDDMAGLKFRIREVPTDVAFIKGLGAVATPITWGETYTALQQGVVDGQENPIGTISYGKIYEVNKYVTLDGHVYSTHMVIINEKFYQSLPGEIKQVIKEAALLGTNVARGIASLYNYQKLSFLKEKGMTITPLSYDQKQLFVRKAQPAARELIVGKVGKAFFDEFEKGLEKANADALNQIKP
jgi:tripartite ATP-independent transporter DctP family solute receptor